MRLVLYKNKGVGYFRGKKKKWLFHGKKKKKKKDTLTVFHFSMNAAVWVKQ